MTTTANIFVRLVHRAWSADVLACGDADEHIRRQHVGLNEVISRSLLDVLMSLPEGLGVPMDELTVAERRRLRAAPRGVAFEVDGIVVRHLRRPMTVQSVRIDASSWNAAQSGVRRFAPHCERWVVLPAAELEPVVRLEAEHLGVGLSTDGDVVVPPRQFVQRRFTSIGWQFTERLYGRWLAEGQPVWRVPVAPWEPSAAAR